MTRPKPRRMRPTEAWMIVDGHGDACTACGLRWYRDSASEKLRKLHDKHSRVVKVRITEIPSKRK